jgi:serine/threonine protein kinase
MGLGSILTMRDLEYTPYSYAHLSSIAGTFLGAPEYMAPEVVQGASIDAHVDIYALGALLFEWLTGLPPFLGADPLSTALLHVQQPAPSLLSLRPDLPFALDLVLARALERRPEQRYPSASHLANAFERAIKVMGKIGKAASPSRQPVPPPQAEGQVASDWSKKQVVPSSMAKTGNLSAIPEQTTGSSKNEEEATDFSARWSTASLATEQTSSTGSLTNDSVMVQDSVPPPQPPIDKGRRKVTALLAIGGGIVVGFLGVGGIDLVRTMMQSQQTQQMPGMPMNGKMPMGQTTPSARPSPTSTPMKMPGSMPMP